MSFFDKLFETPEERRVKRLIEDSRVKDETTNGPVRKLSMAITCATHKAYLNLARVFDFSKEGHPPSQPQILTFYEFMYFFMHLTLRTTVAKGFTESQINKLQGYLGPLLVWTAVESFFKNWPEELKAKMRSEIFEKLNDAEMEYSECKGLFSSDDPLNRNMLIGRLAGNAVALWERPSDESAKMAVVAAATQALSEMNLDRLVDDAKAVIDSVDSELIKKFWTK